MIVDRISNLDFYRGLQPSFMRALEFLRDSDLLTIPVGRHDLDGDRLDDLITSSNFRVASVLLNQVDCNRIRPFVTMDVAGLAWSAGCTGALYDVATGRVDALRASGDFRAATCVAQNGATPSLSFAGVPPVGSIDWFVVRIAGQSWNEGGETVSRDLSLSACP